MKTETDFVEMLSKDVKDGNYVKDGKEFLEKLKTASVAAATEKFVRDHAKEIGGALVGGAMAVGYQYLQNKPGKDGGLSAQQRSARADKEGSEASIAASKKMGKEPTFKQDVAKATSKAVSEIADIFAKHPAKGALMAAPIGLAAGAKLSKLFSK